MTESIPTDGVPIPDAPATASMSLSREVLLARRSASKSIAFGSREFSARQRAEILVDPQSFHDVSPMRRARGGNYGGASPEVDGDGVVVGWGQIDGRRVIVVSHDFAVAGGSIGATFAERIMAGQQLAIDSGCPIVYINDSGGARIHEGIESLEGCGGIFALNVAATRRVPQVSIIVGPCAGAAAYSPALTDWTIMVKGQGQMFLTGPDIVRAATGEVVSAEDIGGSRLHTAESGVAHLEVESEREAYSVARRLLAFLPSSSAEAPPTVAPSTPAPADAARLPSVVPIQASKVFDMHRVIAGVLDDRERLELMPTFGRSILTVLAHLDGMPVGIVANQPAARGGILDSASSIKAARFVNFCARFNLPILTLVDVPGFMPGAVEERRGVITHGATLLRAYVEAEVPKLTVVIRKAYGGAYIAMSSHALGADFSWAWAGAEIAVMGPGGAVGLLHRRALKAASDPDALRAELAAEYREKVTRPYIAAEAGIVDEVILPEETRARIAAALSFLTRTAPEAPRPNRSRRIS